MRLRIALICLLASSCLAPAFASDPSADGARVATVEKAKTVAIQASTRDHVFDLKSGERPSEVVLLRIGFPVRNFARSGDRIWQVHFSEFGNVVTKIVWVNAESGRVMLLFPKPR